ncbi:hypothetical protein MUG84_12785 [Paenibacillus sp. KQZ6P-2]|uniref:SMP-30/Gluconolactonase/LRE-like region domain-containing protein n=1 Tax=Paenibacillus mangrovi TaxID=2931978 RepID=A0A9X1WPD2_9BACL|nr:hypothetical protein [Paenibacillus mangrovi]MCJ8012608.1 hypothetical protein [Paenibacillus mangrovi]
MKRSTSKRVMAALMMLVMLSMLSLPDEAGAQSPYKGYTYNQSEETPISINGYLYRDSIDGYDWFAGPLKEPEDLFIAGDDTIYAVDGGNNRVVHFDKSKRLLGIYGDPGGKGQLNGPKGVYVTEEGEVFVADTLNHRIVVFSRDGKFVKEFGAPESPLLGAGFVYSPSKLIIDKRNYMFVVSEGAYQGLLQIDPNGVFKGFFGANLLGFSWEKTIVKFVATPEQKEQLSNEKPPEFSNLIQDQEGFVYSTTLGIPTSQVKRLSAVGVNTLTDIEFGDHHMARRNWERLFSTFIDVTVNDKGVFTALDQTTGRAFQYDKLGNLLFIFGGIGEQNGLFKTPSSIAETSDGTIYIADRTRGRIDRFRTTPFADKVHEATNLYVDGDYEKSAEPWREVLDMNSNYDLAYKAIGKALYKSGKYREAMDYFEMAKARDDYSAAFLEYRKQYMRQHFAWIAGGAVSLYVLLKIGFRLYRKWRSKRSQSKIAVSEGGSAS